MGQLRDANADGLRLLAKRRAALAFAKDAITAPGLSRRLESLWSDDSASLARACHIGSVACSTCSTLARLNMALGRAK